MEAPVVTMYSLHCGLVSLNVRSRSVTPDTHNRKVFLRMRLKTVKGPPAAVATR
jgi:hypothetical protein